MKALVVLLAVLALVWLLTRSRERRGAPPPSAGAGAKPASTKGPTARPALEACAQCGVYLPHEEALPGRGGSFCTAEHRSAFERSHPA